ncbi:hypothetical protein EJB05_03949, partial [Eragrostis curvula]
MTAVLRRWAADVMRARRSSTSIFPPLLEEVEGIKKIGVPSEEVAGALKGMENRCKVYHWFWTRNERKVRGLLRHGLGWRVHAMFYTVVSAYVTVDGYESTNDAVDRYKYGTTFTYLEEPLTSMAEDATPSDIGEEAPPSTAERATASDVGAPDPNDEYSIKNCLTILEAIKELSDEEKAKATNIFKRRTAREIFVNLKNPRVRLIWLKGEIAPRSSHS